MEIPLNRIYPNPDQPRKIFDPAKLEELAASIKEQGLIEPIVAVHRPKPMVECQGCGFKKDGACTHPGGSCTHKEICNQPQEFMIIAGERRWRACRLAGLTTAPVRIIEADDAQIAEMALIENIQREDLKPLEEARAFLRLLDDGHTVASLCQKLGFKHPWKINWRLNLLNLHGKFQEALELELVSQFEAYEMSRLETFEDQDLVFQKIRRGELKGQPQVRRFVNALVEARRQQPLFEVSAEKKAAVVSRWDKSLEAVTKLICSSFSSRDCEILNKVFEGDSELNIAKIDLVTNHLKMIKTALQENLSARAAHQVLSKMAP
jgi:ParB family chromosome partitioning protein